MCLRSDAEDLCLFEGFDFAADEIAEAEVLDGDGGLGGDGGDEVFGLLGEDAGLGMAVEEASEDFVRLRFDGDGEIAADREVALGHSAIWGVVAVAGVLGDVIRADDSFAFEGGAEDLGVARHGIGGEAFAVDAGEGVEGVDFAGRVDVVVEERAEFGSAEFQSDICCGLHQRLQFGGFGEEKAAANEEFEIPPKALLLILGWFWAG